MYRCLGAFALTYCPGSHVQVTRRHNHQLGRRNLAPEAASYLRGKRYLEEKRPHGGGRAEASAQSEHLRKAVTEREREQVLKMIT